MHAHHCGRLLRNTLVVAYDANTALLFQNLLAPLVSMARVLSLTPWPAAAATAFLDSL
jgi:hypothetical protein